MDTQLSPPAFEKDTKGTQRSSVQDHPKTAPRSSKTTPRQPKRPQTPQNATEIHPRPSRIPSRLPRNPKTSHLSFQNQPKIHPNTSPEHVEYTEAESLDFRQPSDTFNGLPYSRTNNNQHNIVLKLLSKTARKLRPEQDTKCTPKSSPKNFEALPEQGQDGTRRPL